MKNLTISIVALSLLLLTTLGCGSLNPFSSEKSSTNSNKTLTDKGIDTAVGEETTGIPECDEVMDMIAAEANNPDDGYVVKAIKSVFLNKLKESVRRAIEENKNSNSNANADIAKTCTDFKKELIKFKEEQEKKNQQQ